MIDPISEIHVTAADAATRTAQEQELWTHRHAAKVAAYLADNNAADAAHFAKAAARAATVAADAAALAEGWLHTAGLNADNNPARKAADNAAKVADNAAGLLDALTPNP